MAVHHLGLQGREEALGDGVVPHSRGRLSDWRMPCRSSRLLTAADAYTNRMILGLDRPTRGSVTVNGQSYADLPAPMHEVGSLLDAKAIQGGRTAYQPLRW